jgi:hypothetical protein
MKKTALQQVMSELEKLHPNLFDIHSEKGRQFVNHFHKFLELEKEQIMDAFNSGENSDDYFFPSLKLKECEVYYNETYKSK